VVHLHSEGRESWWAYAGRTLVNDCCCFVPIHTFTGLPRAIAEPGGGGSAAVKVKDAARIPNKAGTPKPKPQRFGLGLLKWGLGAVAIYVIAYKASPTSPSGGGAFKIGEGTDNRVQPVDVGWGNGTVLSMPNRFSALDRKKKPPKQRGKVDPPKTAEEGGPEENSKGDTPKKKAGGKADTPQSAEDGSPSDGAALEISEGTDDRVQSVDPPKTVQNRFSALDGVNSNGRSSVWQKVVTPSRPKTKVGNTGDKGKAKGDTKTVVGGNGSVRSMQDRFSALDGATSKGRSSHKQKVVTSSPPKTKVGNTGDKGKAKGDTNDGQPPAYQILDIIGAIKVEGTLDAATDVYGDIKVSCVARNAASLNDDSSNFKLCTSGCESEVALQVTGFTRLASGDANITFSVSNEDVASYTMLEILIGGGGDDPVHLEWRPR
jgi:hypothetical protein